MLLFVIGAPGSGKGTLCSKLAKEYKFHHVSVGDTLRQFVKELGEVLDKKILECVKNQELLPVEALGTILKYEVERLKRTGHNDVIIDGFPRRLDQVARVEEMIGKPDLVLFFNCPKGKAKQRLLARNISGRNDREEVFEKRYQEFAMLNGEIVAEYRRRRILREVDTSYETPTSWTGLLITLMDERLGNKSFFSRRVN
ncbi:uncharacterized protein K452DRAFT_299764 [Aplosporella prunicola CBS 121167]|uniref:Adenylate kinase n=1 Tax=Aplosporella prunicola CBS 121167 TaxID=1176127 RepID=A0A6A6BD63_9PEZI|nr:uncharacterized protein K452DRAFT_299764 [Aplosporella prunicola CBS 121167]KAF2140421.1 hypothetical protein K452DRAFT_299764 [Aplosporella prunicola CBS 121167]